MPRASTAKDPRPRRRRPAASKRAAKSSSPAAGAARAPLRWGNAWTILRRHFRENQLLLRASALTYATLLSAVPVMAVVVALLRAYGVEDRVLPWLEQQASVGLDTAAVQELFRIIRGVNPATLGIFGAIGLLFTALMLLAQVDSAFNVVWGVREGRKLATRFVGYGGLLLIGPLWIAVWTSVVSWTRLVVANWPQGWSSFGVLLTRVVSPAVGLVVLTLLYLVAPNARVKLRAALAGAVAAVLLLELNQFVFVSFVKSSMAYNLLYGTFAAFPIFLAWMYSNWVVVLVGVEVGYLVQNVPTWLREAEEPGQLSWEDRERLALASAALLAVRGEMEAEALAEELEVTARLVHRPLDDLQDAGWLEPVCDSNGQQLGYKAKPTLPRATLAELRRSLRELGEESPAGVRHRALLVPPTWMSVLEPLERDADRPFETWSARELAERLEPPLAARRRARALEGAAT